MIGRTNVGGGGSGANLTVNAPIGVTVRVEKDGKVKKKTAAGGVAVFKGLKTGEWGISIYDDSHDETIPVKKSIVADYDITVNFFTATIHVTYPAGSTCTATDGTTTLTAPDTSGSWDCVVPNAGTWTVALDSGFYEHVAIAKNGEVHELNRWHIYNNGVEYADICGEWASMLDGPGPSNYFTKNSDHLRLYPYSATSGVWAKIWHKNNIDLSKVSTVCAVTSVPKNIDGYGKIAIYESSDESAADTPWSLDSSVAIATIVAGTLTTVRLNVSDYTQMGVVAFTCSSGTLPLDIYEIWVE